MTREIKFRAWDIKWKKMEQVTEIVFDYWEIHTTRASQKERVNWCWCCDDREDTRYYIKDVELMQFTGLLDKNWKPIYEWDIVLINPYTTQYKPIKSIVKWQEVWYYPRIWQIDCFVWDDKEVIGNIYENKDLIPN